VNLCWARASVGFIEKTTAQAVAATTPPVKIAKVFGDTFVFLRVVFACPTLDSVEYRKYTYEIGGLNPASRRNESFVPLFNYTS
jgi:hypothetical protein